MNDDQVTKLLEEIRDLHKVQIEKYDATLNNQREAIALAKHGARRSIIFLIIIAVMIAAFLMFSVGSR